jgi:hypothetical protein
MLLEILNTRAGLCNGTRLIVREMKKNVINAHILKGNDSDKEFSSQESI